MCMYIPFPFSFVLLSRFSVCCLCFSRRCFLMLFGEVPKIPFLTLFFHHKHKLKHRLRNTYTFVFLLLFLLSVLHQDKGNSHNRHSTFWLAHSSSSTKLRIGKNRIKRKSEKKRGKTKIFPVPSVAP